jgi:mevalonate kinase
MRLTQGQIFHIKSYKRFMIHNNKNSGGNKRGLFYSKLLLFGEYSVLFDSMALYVPFSHFTGDLRFPGRNKGNNYGYEHVSNAILGRYAGGLESSGNALKLRDFFDTVAFKRDIAKGLFFDSGIPQGYGLGSSGALCAALYDKYAQNRIDHDLPGGNREMVMLKKIFGILEEWFHGTSSGLDPLCCYLRRPVLVNPDEGISPALTHEHCMEHGPAIFLINTGRPGRTKPLVKLFMEWSRKKKFMEMINSDMIPAVNNCISSMIKPDQSAFMPVLKELSLLQFRNMKNMIPGGFCSIWEKGTESDDFYIKLCGSGGGGYLLGFTREMKKTSLIFTEEGIDILPVYHPGSTSILKNLATIYYFTEKV